MKNDNATIRSVLLTREHVLKLLDDDEVNRVCQAETQDQLVAGEEFLDLKQLERGVRRAGPTRPQGNAAMARVLPKKAVTDATWTKILGLLPSPAVA